MAEKKRITDREAKALASGVIHSEPVGGRGSGVLYLKGQENSVRAYYRYTSPPKGRDYIPLGTLGGDISLRDARDECSRLSGIRKEHPHLKEWLLSVIEHERQRLDDEKSAKEQAEKNATFKELLDDYVANMRAHGQVSAGEVEQKFAAEIFASAQSVADLKAKDITPDHILDIIRPVSQRGALVSRNRIRSYLHAAFQFALKNEYNETRISEKRYGLLINPVSVIPVLTHAENVGERVLNNAELRQFYFHVGDVNNVGVVMSSFVRFLFVIGGQRPLQVSRVPWEGYDFKERTIRILDLKGKRNSDQPRVHLVPLPDAAIEILEELRPLNGRYKWPFTSNGNVPVSMGGVKNVVQRFRESDFGKINGEQIPHFTSRDIRRTCKQIMTRAEIRRDLRNLLQNHGQTGVDVKSYANDPEAHLPEKRNAMLLYTAALHKELNKRS